MGKINVQDILRDANALLCFYPLEQTCFKLCATIQKNDTLDNFQQMLLKNYLKIINLFLE